jgi:hypothetical protein
LISEKLFTLSACVWLSCDSTPLCAELTAADRAAVLPGASVRSANWFFNTTITVSVTFVDSALACAAVRGGWVAAGRPAARAVCAVCAVCACAAKGSATDDMATTVTGVAIAPQRKSLVYRI